MTNYACAGDCVCDQRKVTSTQPSFALELCILVLIKIIFKCD